MVRELVAEVSESDLRELLRGETESLRLPTSNDAPLSTPIAETELNETYTITGVVRSVEETNTFDRDDGSEGQVRNVTLQDRTGDIRVSLWGDKADVDISVGDYLHLFGAEVDTGYQEKREASVGYDSTMRAIPADEADQQITLTTKQ